VYFLDCHLHRFACTDVVREIAVYPTICDIYVIFLRYAYLTLVEIRVKVVFPFFSSWVWFFIRWIYEMRRRKYESKEHKYGHKIKGVIWLLFSR